MDHSSIFGLSCFVIALSLLARLPHSLSLCGVTEVPNPRHTEEIDIWPLNL